MIRNILFDMGNVLIRFEPETFLTLAGVTEEADRDLLRRVVFRSVEWVKLDRGDLTDEEALALMFPRLPERLHPVARQMVSHWADFGLVVDGMYDLVQELHEKGYELYLLTNAALSQRRFFPTFPVGRFFEGRVFLSAAWKLVKPCTDYFEAALRHFGLKGEECVFIDDAPYNVEAALRTGTEGIIFRGSAPLLRQELRALGVDVAEE